MLNFSYILLIVSIFLIIFSIIQIIRFRKNTKRKTYIKLFGISIIIFIFSCILGGISESNIDSENEKNKNSKPKTEQVSKKSKKDNENKKLDKKESKELKQARKKNDRNNIKEYKQALSDVPNKTNGLISKAYVNEYGETIAVLSDETLQSGNSQMNNVAHSAYNGIQNIMNEFNIKNIETSKVTGSIVIQDESGNEIAKTSLLGKYKYTGDK